jgi:transposase
MARTKKALSHLTDVEKGQILAFGALGMSSRAIAVHLKRGQTTVARVLRRHQKTGTTCRKPGSGARRKTTPKQDRRIKFLVTRDRRMPAKAIKQDLGLDHVSESLIRRRVREWGFVGGWSRKKPFVSDTNRRKRVQWAREHLGWTKDQWARVLFSDESPYTIRGSTRFRVWRHPNDRYSPKVVKSTIKHSAKVMVWGCFAAHGVGHLHRVVGIMDQKQYRQILIHHMKPSAKSLFGKGKFVFQQDNDPKHTAKSVRDYLANTGIEVLDWPSQSPDLNPIENLWAIIEQRLASRVAKNEAELFKMLSDCWSNLAPELLNALVESMPRRCQAVIDNKGFPTKY